MSAPCAAQGLAWLPTRLSRLPSRRGGASPCDAVRSPHGPTPSLPPCRARIAARPVVFCPPRPSSPSLCPCSVLPHRSSLSFSAPLSLLLCFSACLPVLLFRSLSVVLLLLCLSILLLLCRSLSAPLSVPASSLRPSRPCAISTGSSTSATSAAPHPVHSARPS